MRSTALWRLLIASFIFLPGCKKDKTDNNNNNDQAPTLFGTGWTSSENYSQSIPVAITYGNYQSTGSLPSSVDLTAKFPPIGDQGQLGTCVAWATGYNTKSYLDGVAKNLSPAQLQSFTNQYSATDLFFSISPSQRSCNNGTQFELAFNKLVERGVNTIANVPNDGICHQNSPGNPSTAASNKIKNFRRLTGGTVKEIKEYLAQGVPVVFGAMVNRQFQEWRSSAVMNSLTYTGNEGGHAMVIAGYDDGRSAFRIINSWGTGWGDNGYAWIGYDFMINKFCVQGGQRSLFVAFNDNTVPINPPPTGGGPDMTALVMSDYTLFPNQSFYTNARRAFFDVKNVGTQTINSSTNWNIYYLWVNAFNANNYGVIFRGEFTNTIPANTYVNINSNYTRINYNLAPGSTLGQTVMGLPYVTWDYLMPTLTGSYYLVMFIDKGSSTETNQTNNVFYVTQSPKFFTSGYSSKSPDGTVAINKFGFDDMLSFKHELPAGSATSENSLQPYRKLSNEKFANAYSSEEIVDFLKYKVKHGGL